MFDFMNDEPIASSSNATNPTNGIPNSSFSGDMLLSELNTTSNANTTSASTETASSPEPPSTPNTKRLSQTTNRISMYDLKPRFVVKFISATDIPPADFRSKCDPYIKSYISKHDDNEIDSEGRKVYRLKKASGNVYTPKRLDCKSAIWNCYRDFRMFPPEGAILTVELYHATSDSSKPDSLLGKIDIPIAQLIDETPKTFFLVNYRVS